MQQDFREQRTLLRLRLQAQRQLFASQIAANQLSAARQDASMDSSSYYPRSMTMRLMTQQYSLPFLLITELVPLLLRIFRRKSAATY